jgi:hypothetical protein
MVPVRPLLVRSLHKGVTFKFSKVHNQNFFLIDVLKNCHHILYIQEGNTSLWEIDKQIIDGSALCVTLHLQETQLLAFHYPSAHLLMSQIAH